MNIQKYNYHIPSDGSHSLENDSFENPQINSGTNRYSKPYDFGIKELCHKNGISSEKNRIDGKKPESLILERKLSGINVPVSSRRIISSKERQDHERVVMNTAENVTEREMPRLTKEVDNNKKTKLLTNSSIFNQRYQNVVKFPNYRQRKKGAFERKLRRCGVELDGEATISNLRKILQPYIYQEINNILDKYIEVYFMSAFNNIRENVSLTSENWSQTLKCSISKSFYKQYCDIANVNPFDQTSIVDEDFPYFKTFQRTNKEKNMSTENYTKSEIDNSTGHTSDTNSQCSRLSNLEVKPDIVGLNVLETSSLSERILDHNTEYPNGQANCLMPRKRNIELYKVGSEKSPCSNTKYPKIMYSSQPHPTDSYSSYYSNNSRPLIVQKIQESTGPETSRFDKRNQSFFLSQSLNEPSASSFEPEIYLNGRNTITANNNSDPLFPNLFHSRKL